MIKKSPLANSLLMVLMSLIFLSIFKTEILAWNFSFCFMKIILLCKKKQTYFLPPFKKDIGYWLRGAEMMGFHIHYSWSVK